MFPLLQRKLFYCILLVLASVKLAAQPYTSINVDKDKPKEYKDRQLRAEKTGDVKYTKGVRLYQNMVTHYNYWFNGNTKINDIISNAKDEHKDDYAELLSFYNYSLNATAAQKIQLDSVVYKCNAGILLHDLRNDWIDDMYLLLGKAYFFEKKFDSAHHVFQYINYAYSPKDDGFDLPIGSNGSNNNGIFTVSTVEKTNKLKRVFVNPPVRNESFLWLIRTYLEQNKTDEATGLIEILKADPNFPSRLQPTLNELCAYNFYKQQMYDSAASSLQKCFHNASDMSEKARWEYLCGQMYQLASENSSALAMFKSAMNHATDPYMDAYARLNIVGLYASNNKETAIKNNLEELYKLAKRAKYEQYRDIIYYAAAVLENQQKNIPVAIADLKKALEYGNDNQLQQQKNLLLLSDIYYVQRDFKSAYENYNKINVSALVNANDKERIDSVKLPLKTIVDNSNQIHLQDSLLYLASLPVQERLSAVKKVYKQLRKDKGLKEAADDANFDYNTWSQLNNPTSVSFANSAGNDFYFRNVQVKQQGYNEFRTVWGNRPNVDNWQRQSAIRSVSYSNNIPSANLSDVDKAVIATKETEPTSIQSLLSNIPLTDAKAKEANDVIANGLFDNAQLFQNKLEEYPSAIQSYSTLLKRYPGFKNEEKAMFNLAYCYLTTGNNPAFDSLKNELNNKYPQGLYTYRINKGEILNNSDSSVTVGTFTKDFISRKYNEIYNLFIEGKFKQAQEEKQVADISFGKKFWTPQLSYIEAIYYVTQKNDSTAVNRLQHIVSAFPQSPIAVKAATMLDVLNRRQQIESYLTNLQLDSVYEEPTMIVLDTVSSVKIEKPKINTDSILNAVTAAKKINNVIPQVIISNNVVKPTVAVDSFVFNPAEQYYFMVTLNKVDEVYVNETRNAFGRYNQQQFPTKKIGTIDTKTVEQYSLVLVGPFANVIDALDYYDKTKSLVSSRIIPWLTKEKYTLSFIGTGNLEKIKSAKKVEEYSTFIKNLFPDRF